MRIISLKSTFLAMIALSLVSCGGEDPLNPNASSISLSASSPSISYGQPVTINWIGHNVASIQKANFPVDSKVINGSLTDTPAITTTYSITAWGDDFKDHSKTVTVTVAKGNKKILFIGDVAQSGINQVVEFLQSLTTQTVQVSLTLPSSFTADVVVVTPSASVSPSDVAAIKSQLNGGGGVVLVGRSTRLLATGDSTENDISAIGSFCAGVTYSTDGYYDVVPTSPIGVPLGVCAFGEGLGNQSIVKPISANAISLTTGTDYSAAFAYSPPSGGRIGYAGSTPIDSTSNSLAMRTVFLSLVRWASHE